MKNATVCIIGRSNVGKSTIFNRLAKTKISIVEDIPGVTRDRVYAQVIHNNYRFHLIDTGGLELDDDSFSKEIKLQVAMALEESDLILFVVDGKEGMTESDRYIRDMLVKHNKQVIVVINKTDCKESDLNSYSFYELGFESYVNVSGEHNIGIGLLLDEIVEKLNLTKKEDLVIESGIKFALIGRPNVGKSSLVNALLNENRVIVSEEGGTTRDAIDISFTYNKEKFVAIDTAGIRKKSKIYENIEHYSLVRSLKAIERADVCVLVLDGEEGIVENDKHISGYCLEVGKPLILVVNKWDTVKDISMHKYEATIRNEFQFLTHVPIVFVSALRKKRIHLIIPEILRVYDNSKREIKTSALNKIIMEAFALNPPPSYKGKRLKIYFSVQTGTCPPKYTIQVNDKKLLHFSYKRYLENKIRESIELEGTPIILHFKNKSE